MPDEVVAPADQSVTIKVDGQEVQARPGEYVIAAAERAGVYIPRFCYHPRMKSVGMCRMCVVDISGPRGFSLQPACFIPVSEGQEVITNSDRIKKIQDGVLEFLLANHPLDCPVCDKGGECPLQDQTVSFGPGESRFVEEKRHFEKPIPLSPVVDLDRERCVLCDRCTRFASDIAGDPLIEFMDRGGQTQINVFPDDPFSSYFSGNTVQICPVGALLAKPYRFRARPWDLTETESTCTSCSVGCRVAVQSSDDKLIRYLGIDSDPVNQGWLCDKGRFDYEAFNSEDRFTSPLIKKNDEFIQKSWGEALDVAATAIEAAIAEKGAESVAVLGGSRLANEDAYTWAKLAKAVIGTDSVDCQLGDGLSAETILGYPHATIDEACAAPAVVLMAPDLKEELPVLYLRLRQAALEKGVPFIEITPRATSMSPHAKHTFLYPAGQAEAVATALVDPSGEVPSWIDASELEAARRLLSFEGAVAVLGRPSVAESSAGIEKSAGVLFGGLKGLRFLPALRRSNVHGALDMGLAPGILPGRVSIDAARDDFEFIWGSLPDKRGRDAGGILNAALAGDVDVLILLGADPMQDFPDNVLASEAIKKLNETGMIIAVDCLNNTSSQYAHVVLPAAGYGERNGTTTNLEGRITQLGTKVSSPGVAWADWVIATELAERLGTELGFESIEQIWDEIGRLAPSHRGVSPDLLRANPDGLVPQADAGTAPLASAGPRSDSKPQSLQRSARRKLTLVSSRHLYDMGTLVQHSPSLAKLHRRVVLEVNPADLTLLGIGDEQMVKVESTRGSQVLPIASSERVPEGSAWMAFNFDDGAGRMIDSRSEVTTITLEKL